MASTSVGNPVVLTSQPDPVTGQAASIPAAGTSPALVSCLPEKRLTAATWEEIARTLNTAEDGSPGTVDVELRPGGELVVTGRDRSAQLLSRLPKGRMAWLSSV